MSSPASAAPPVIGLFTDYGWDDPYVAQLKGAILTVNSNARLLDITHTVTPFNVTEGAYLLDECAEEFPGGTIFVAVVDPQVGTDRQPVLLQTAKGKYFVGPDNGLFSQVIAHEGFGRAWVLDKPEFFRAGDTSRTFHGRDIFGPVAAHLAAGTDPNSFGTPLKALMLLPEKIPTFAGGVIATTVVHNDRFGNVILNLDASNEVAAKLHQGNLVKISIGKENYSAPLVKTYGEVEKGRLLLLYNSSGLLEISMNQGSAVKQLKVEPGTSVFLKP
jgi:S-adenosylmethionine hydrolase